MKKPFPEHLEDYDHAQVNARVELWRTNTLVSSWPVDALETFLDSCRPLAQAIVNVLHESGIMKQHQELPRFRLSSETRAEYRWNGLPDAAIEILFGVPAPDHHRRPREGRMYHPLPLARGTWVPRRSALRNTDSFQRPVGLCQALRSSTKLCQALSSSAQTVKPGTRLHAGPAGPSSPATSLPHRHNARQPPDTTNMSRYSTLSQHH
ncbi:hypothetical protein A1Q2_03766 [Trichosporon asahii var. asahii CBS 8904]|uniref:Uncharacterized protein n=1 Tax=Trichosporon asahii var. asahii (strain CBS 8904) TaxID=1220162 RepID=K1VR45_TRIAC|nr:hypothetical protein A1Q2_03766 [Trichosporon asahii var. asahii CBS 8904]